MSVPEDIRKLIRQARSARRHLARPCNESPQQTFQFELRVLNFYRTRCRQLESICTAGNTGFKLAGQPRFNRGFLVLDKLPVLFPEKLIDPGLSPSEPHFTKAVLS